MWLLFLLFFPALVHAQIAPLARETPGFTFGVMTNHTKLTIPAYQQAITDNFTGIIITRQMSNILTAPDVYDFSILDKQLDFAQANNLTSHAHALIWRNDTTPSWVGFTNTGCGSMTAYQVDTLMRDYIQTVITHRGPQIAVWDVVNEPLRTPLSQNCWSQKLGYPNYIINAFRYASVVVSPNTLLRLNEDFGPSLELTDRIDGFFRLVDEVRDRGVQIDIIGIQCHLRADTIKANGTLYKQNLLKILREAQRRNLQLHITELDVYEGPQNDYAAQTTIYNDLLTTCLESPICTSFSTWGVNDSESFLLAFWPDAEPLLLGPTYLPKDMVNGMIGTFRRGIRSTWAIKQPASLVIW